MKIYIFQQLSEDYHLYGFIFVFGIEVKYRWLFDKSCRFQTAETVPKNGRNA
jgi:hypothetical protein